MIAEIETKITNQPTLAPVIGKISIGTVINNEIPKKNQDDLNKKMNKKRITHGG